MMPLYAKNALREMGLVGVMEIANGIGTTISVCQKNLQVCNVNCVLSNVNYCCLIPPTLLALEIVFYPSIKMSSEGPLKSFFGTFERFLLLN